MWRTDRCCQKSAPLGWPEASEPTSPPADRSLTHARSSHRRRDALAHRTRQQGFAEGPAPRRPVGDDRAGGPGQGPRAGPEHGRRPLPRLRAPRRGVGQQHGPRGERAERDGQRPGRHDHPLLRVVGADHPDGLPRHQGRRGRRVRLRRRRDGLPLLQGHLRPPARHREPRLRRGPVAHRGDRGEQRALARPPRGRGPARRLHRDGPDRREPRHQPGPEPPGARRVRRPVAEPRREGDRERVLAAGDHPGDHARRHGRHAPTTARARA